MLISLWQGFSDSVGIASKTNNIIDLLHRLLLRHLEILNNQEAPICAALLLRSFERIHNPWYRLSFEIEIPDIHHHSDNNRLLHLLDMVNQ
jgi:hypothetical protein